MTKKKKSTKDVKLKLPALSKGEVEKLTENAERAFELANIVSADLAKFQEIASRAILMPDLTQASLIAKLVEQQNQMFAPLAAIGELFSPRPLLQELIDAQTKSLKAFTNGIFTNPFQGYLDVQMSALAEIAKSPLEEIGKSWVDLTLIEVPGLTRVTLDLDSVLPSPRFPDQYDVITTTHRVTDVGLIVQEVESRVAMRLEILEERVEARLVAQEGKLDELLSFFRTQDIGMVKVHSIKPDIPNFCLIIDTTKVSLQHDSKEHQLCTVVLSSLANAVKSWEVMEIVEALGESMDNDDWIGVISRAAGRLNNKIKMSTGLDQFFIYSNKLLVVNPNYHRFFELT